MSLVEQMPIYKCHKQVRALKIKTILVNITDERVLYFYPNNGVYYPTKTISQELYDKHKPQDNWYYIVYKDGYESFSPPEAFEEGYTLYVVGAY